MSPSQMPRLEIRVLGSFQVRLDKRLVSDFESDKVRALLAYLATENEERHRRESLASLLWPEMPERRARRNLRGALADLRKAIGDHDADPPFLDITRQTLQFSSAGDSWVDVQDFLAFSASEATGDQSVPEVEAAVDLYRGEFLEGFAISGSPRFDEWLTLRREQLSRVMAQALGRLANHYQRRDTLELALKFAWQLVEFDPTAEAAHRRLIRLLALNGQTSEAIARFETYRDMLDRDLGVRPTDETMQLVEQIRGGELRRAASSRRKSVIRGFEIQEEIGRGSFGTVYRAYQPGIDREVAVKVIHPQFSGEPEYIRRFEAEAQLIARLEHLHIAPLYDYWRDPEGAYLVTRLFRGGSLKDSLKGGPWEPGDANRLVHQVAAALAAAHEKKIVHRDVKPANILLDEVGNAYLSDFGIALPVSHNRSPDENGLVTGSPAYVAPEQILGDPATELADVYSLGIVLFELVTGVHPFPGLSAPELLSRHLKEPLPSLHQYRPDLPAPVDMTIQRATEKDPRDRFSGVAELATAFEEALGGGRVEAFRRPAKKVVNPYKGLRPFEEADAGEFFGREEFVQRLVARLGDGDPLLILVGASGSGKSSVLKAGLLHALRRGEVRGSEQWFIANLVLGEHPLEDLVSALASVSTSSVRPIRAGEIKDGSDLLRLVDRVLPAPDAKLVLVIDDLESLFSRERDREERHEFVTLLAELIVEPASSVVVIASLRADYYDRPLQYPEFGKLVSRYAEPVLPLSPEQLQRAITRPAEIAGVEPTSELVAALVRDIADQPGALPLVQYALTALFEERENGRMTLAAYRKVGGVSGALARRAQELYDDMPEEMQKAARGLFLRLVRPGQGAQQSARNALWQDLNNMNLAGIDDVIELFASHRLLTVGRDQATRAPTVELAHDALIREWPQLRSWIEENRQALRLRHVLRGSAQEWETANRDPRFLLRGGRLDQYREWGRGDPLALDELEWEFLEESRTARRSRQAIEAQRLAREADLEQRAVNRLRSLVLVLTAAAVVAVVLTVFALRSEREARLEASLRATQQVVAELEAARRATQQSLAETEALLRATQQAEAERSSAEAIRQAQIATARELANAASLNLDVDPERSLLLALEAAKVTRTADGRVLPEITEVLHRALQMHRVRLRLEPAGAATFSPDGSHIATAGPDDVVRIWDASSGTLLMKLSGHAGRVSNTSFSPAGDRLVSASWDGTARVWHLASGEVELTLEGHSDRLVSPAFSPDGSLIATTSTDGTARLWDAMTGEELFVLPHSGPTAGPHFSPDGRRLAVADDAAAVARIWSTGTGEEVLTLIGHTEGLSEVAFSPDGSRLATAGSDLTLRLWDAATGEQLQVLEGHTGWIFTVEFAPDGEHLVSGSQDGTARVWEVDSGEEILRLAGHSSGVSELSLSPDGAKVVTAGEDGTARVWDIRPEGGRDWLTLAGHDDVVLDLAISADGDRLATASWDRTAKVWDLFTGELLLVLEGHRDQLGGVAFAPDGLFAATASYDGTARIWDLSNGQATATLLGHSGPVTGVDFNPDGKLLATGGLDGTARIWEVQSAEEIQTFRGHSDWVFRVAFSPDGAQLATASWDGVAKLWDVGTGRELATLGDHSAAVTSVAFSADGERLLTTSFDTQIRIWELEDVLSNPGADHHVPSRILAGHNGIVWDAVLSGDGELVASASFDGTVKLWDPRAGTIELNLSAPNSIPFASVAISPDRRLLAAAGGDGTVRIFLLPEQELLSLAHDRVTRGLTESECRQYLHLEACPARP